MSTVPYSAFLDDVMPDVGGATSDVVLHAIQNSCIQFCEQTNFLWERQDPFLLEKDRPEYDLFAPAGAKVFKVLEVCTERYPLTPRNSQWLKNKYPNWSAWTGMPRYYNMPIETVVRVVPYPSASDSVDPTLDTLTVTVAYKPTRNSTLVDSRLYEEYLEVIAAGAKYRLMSSPAKPYSNVDYAALNFKIFWQGVAKAKRDVQGALSNALQRVTPNKAA